MPHDTPSPAEQLLKFIDASPSPWHAVATTAEMLRAAGFQELRETAVWLLEPGARYYVIRDQSSIIAFVGGTRPVAEAGFRVIGAHTDSPGLRIKPNPLSHKGDWLRLGVEVYGGPILATFADRDLSLAGRVAVHKGGGPSDIDMRLVRFEKPLLRLPNLAIHLNREVNKEGLKFNAQEQLPLILSAAGNGNDKHVFKQLLSDKLGINPDQMLGWELAVYDTQPGSLYGPSQEFFADSQLDNLASCHSALQALLELTGQPHPESTESTLMLAMFDHEEVGSGSAKGADGSFLKDVMSRIACAQSTAEDAIFRALASSFMLSTDMAHAWHPNFPDRHDEQHRPMINAGPVIKVNHNQRYSTDAQTEALFVAICKERSIPYQKFVNRSDLACGSTIGPMTAAKTGIRSLDIGNPMWSMHSVRESAGVADHLHMINAMQGFLTV